MPHIKKLTQDLTIADLLENRIWQYVSSDDTYVRPVKKLPVHSLEQRIIGTKVKFRNGSEHWAILTNVNLNNSHKNEHFLGIWIDNEGHWFDIARYFDADRDIHGPQALATLLGLSLEEIFPIAYDISDVTVGLPAVVRSTILVEPRGKLSEDEIIDLSLAPD